MKRATILIVVFVGNKEFVQQSVIVCNLATIMRISCLLAVTRGVGRREKSLSLKKVARSTSRIASAASFEASERLAMRTLGASLVEES